MLHRRDALTLETKEILRAITIFKALEYGQLIKLLRGKEPSAGVILRNLSRQKRIFHDENTGIVTDTQQSAEKPDMRMINAFWVFLEFNDKAEYYNTGDYPTLISFFANEEHYEIIFAGYGNEMTLNFALSKNTGGAKRIVIIDSQEQIHKLRVRGLLCFCTVSSDGDVQFFKIG